MSTGYLGELINPLTTTLARFLELVYINFHGEVDVYDAKRYNTPPLVPAVMAAMVQRCSEHGDRGDDKDRHEDYQAVYDAWTRLRANWPPGLLIDTASFCGQQRFGGEDSYDPEGKHPELQQLYEPLQDALAQVVQWTYEDMYEVQERLEPGWGNYDW